MALLVDDVTLAEQLDRTWRSRPGFFGWLTATDFKSIGKRYISTAFAFLLLGGLEAAVMRFQLARPENELLGPDRYAQLFSMHGTTMMFLFAVPMVTALGLYFVPLMVGAREVAFPRLNAFGYWMFLMAGGLLYVAFALDTGPDAGWFNYVPLAGPEFGPGKRVDVWAQTVTFTEIAAIIAAVQILVTVFKHRAPGMSLDRIPLYVWAMIVTAFMIMFAMPTVAVASLLLAMDRAIDTHFFNPAEGGDALLWQHLFWFFGHPEVYIIFLPGLGMVSSIVTTFCRRQVFGYPVVVLSMIITGFLSFGLWVHHMFAAPVPQLGASLFTAASMLIAIPTGVQIFCWLATMWLSRPRFDTPMLYVAGFFFIFIIGGLTGVMVASVPFDLQAHDSFFIVAHLHYVLLGGLVFPMFGVFYYWFPKVTGKRLSERLGKIQFWIFLAGVNVAFFPMHQLGLEGMPRRIYTYLPETGWGQLNLVSTIGASIIALSVLLFLVNVVRSLLRPVRADGNLWDAPTLEWATHSPPPSYTFLRPPVVTSLDGLWAVGAEMPVVDGLRSDRREQLVTTVLDANPDSREHLVGESIAPLLLAAAVGGGLITAVFTPWGIPIAFALSVPVFAYWAWPRGSNDIEHVAVDAP